jgi:transcription termination factor Rho
LSNPLDILTAKQIMSDELKKILVYEDEMQRLSTVRNIFGSSYVSSRMQTLYELMDKSTRNFDIYQKMESAAKSHLKFSGK